jgi:hypothetical protein
LDKVGSVIHIGEDVVEKRPLAIGELAVEAFIAIDSYDVIQRVLA